jgi:AmiR/NasT family two-component response regulator
MAELSLRVAVADDDADMRRYLHETLPRLGCQVVASAAGGAALLPQLGEARPDLLITDVRMAGMDGIELARAVNRDRPLPVILLSAHSDTELIARAEADYIMAYLIKPVGEKDLRAAIPLAMLRFRHFQALATEAASLRQALEDRKLIEKAKGTLMRRLRVDEEDAFRRLRLLASSQNRKLAEIGRDVLAADEIFRALEGIVAGAGP